MQQQEQMGLKGIYKITHKRNGRVINEFEIENGITNEGKDALLDIMFHNDTQIGTWYFGLIDNSGYSAVAAGDTHASHAGWTENTDYSETVRQEWTEAAASSQSIASSSNSDFSINATATIRGVFLANINTKGSTAAGTLWSTVLFASAVSVVSGDTISISYTLSVS